VARECCSCRSTRCPAWAACASECALANGTWHAGGHALFALWAGSGQLVTSIGGEASDYGASGFCANGQTIGIALDLVDRTLQALFYHIILTFL
jgi:hypothetical protein